MANKSKNIMVEIVSAWKWIEPHIKYLQICILGKSKLRYKFKFA